MKKGEGEKTSLGRRRRGEASGVGSSRPDGLKKKRRGIRSAYANTRPDSGPRDVASVDQGRSVRFAKF